MNIIQRRLQGFPGEGVPIEAGSFLPESKAGLARSLKHGEPLQQAGVVLFELNSGLPGEGLLDPSQIASQVRLLVERICQQMNVFRRVPLAPPVCLFNECVPLIIRRPLA